MQRLPVHGFVLVGGQSSRMGTDKALLPFHGRPMVEIAVGKLKEVCEVVSVVGNRDDLAAFAPVVHEARVGCGPVAGVEAGLAAAERAWTMFIPVDVPLVPASVLHEWADAVLARDEVRVSHLFAEVNQPAFCMVQRSCEAAVHASVEAGERRLLRLLSGLEGYWRYDLPSREVERWFANVNTPEELIAAEAASY
ncbi:MAG: molybdenum cofactor guanylyltransferase [Acidobacteriaceae bacterium]|nr:molybdenum cofactor guanylyltransferase [Acidobacteriaceae bacterium]